MNLPRILIVDDHRLFADGLARVLQPRFEVVGMLGDGGRLAEAIARWRPDVVVLDISLPDVNGLDALKQLQGRGGCKVIMLTMFGDAHLAAEAFRAGAVGFALKESSDDEILSCIDIVLRGGTYLPPILEREVNSLLFGPVEPSGITLTPRQQQVLRLIVDGYRSAEIAGMLQLPQGAVESIKQQIMQDLRVQSTAALVRYAVQHDLVAP